MFSSTISRRFRFRHWETPGSSGGFTVPELLIASAIVATLLILSITGVDALMKRSQSTACLGSMRALATALWAYHGDHNGWFPPGKPLHPLDNGSFLLNSYLIPTYLAEMPMCPGYRLTPGAKTGNKTHKELLQGYGGGYSVNGILLFAKPANQPAHPDWSETAIYSASRMPFLVDGAYRSCVWTPTHHNQALTGIPSVSVAGRNHGGKYGDSLHFMFLDGHIEMISRNDSREIPEDQKSWLSPPNTQAPFSSWGSATTYPRVHSVSEKHYNTLYGKSDND